MPAESSYRRGRLVALMRRILVGLLAGALACGPGTTMETGDADGTIVARGIGEQIDSLLVASAARGFSGAVLVERHGEIVLRKGYGSTEPGGAYPIRPDTRFFVASVTKGLTGAAILMLRDRGLLSLDQPLTDFFTHVPDELKSANLGLVLTHRAGLGNNYGGTAISERDAAVADIFSYPVEYSPGTDFIYSNDGYSLLAAVVEVVTGEAFETWVTANILEPTGMTSAGFWGHVEDRDPRIFAQKQFSLPDSIRVPNWAYRGADGLAASIMDLHAWANAVRDDSLVDARALLGPHFVLGSGIGVGYGWFVSESPAGTPEQWTRGGETFGHNAVIRWFPDERILVIVQSNAGKFDGQEANRSVSDAVVGLLFLEAG